MNHHAFNTKTLKGKTVVDNVDRGSRACGDARKASITLVGHFGNGHAESLDREPKDGDSVPVDPFGKRR